VVKVLAPLTIPMEQLEAGLDILEAATRNQTQSQKIAAE
jgi:4-aminobutyrate aminotransferase-like enzyme